MCKYYIDVSAAALLSIVPFEHAWQVKMRRRFWFDKVILKNLDVETASKTRHNLNLVYSVAKDAE